MASTIKIILNNNNLHCTISITTAPNVYKNFDDLMYTNQNILIGLGKILIML